MTEIILYFFSSLAIAAALRIFKVIKMSAAILLFFMLFALTYFGGIRALISVLSVFLILIITDFILGKKTKSVTESINKKTGSRGFVQLAVNCLPALAIIVFGALLKLDMSVAVFFSSIAESVADSMASDVGVLSRMPPKSIIGFKPIQRGMSGGVSLLGTAVSAGVSLYAGVIYYMLYEKSIVSVIIIFCSAFSGTLIDSILGALLQAKYLCVVCGKYTEKKIHCNAYTKHCGGLERLDNCAVNLISNISSCVISLLTIILCRGVY